MKICRVMKYYVSLNFLPCIKRRRAVNHRHVFLDSYRSLQLGSEVIALSLEISRVRHSLGKQEIQLSNYFKVLLIVSYYVCHWFNSNEPLIRSHLLVTGTVSVSTNIQTLGFKHLYWKIGIRNIAGTITALVLLQPLTLADNTNLGHDYTP